MAVDWLNEPESGWLEYKSAEALRHPESIVRAVVAMLNGRRDRRAYVVVGVADDGAIEGVEDAERQRDRLQQILDARIEPRGAAVEVESRHVTGRAVVEVRVAHGHGRRVYAERRKGLLGFWRRSGAQSIPMTLHEIEHALSATASRGDWVTKPWSAGLEPGGAGRSLVFGLEARPVRSVKVEKQLLKVATDARPEIRYRRDGWDVLRGGWFGPEPVTVRGRREVGVRTSDAWLRLHRHLEVRFEAREPFVRVDNAGVLEPCPLVEGAATFVRLLGLLAELAQLDGAVELSIGATGVEGCRLGMPDGAAPRLMAGDWNARRPAVPDDVFDAVYRTEWAKLRDGRDTAAEAYPVIRELYDWFGLPEDKIPFWDRESERFRFP